MLSLRKFICQFLESKDLEGFVLNRLKLHFLISSILTFTFLFFCTGVTLNSIEKGVGEELNPFNLTTRFFPFGLIFSSIIVSILLVSVFKVSTYLNGRSRYFLIYLLPLLLFGDFIWDLFQLLKLVFT